MIGPCVGIHPLIVQDDLLTLSGKKRCQIVGGSLGRSVGRSIGRLAALPPMIIRDGSPTKRVG